MAKRRTAGRKQSPSHAAIPGWLWLMAGIFIGLGTAYGVYYYSPTLSLPRYVKSTTLPKEAKQKPHKKVAKAVKKSSEPPPGKPRYEFYTLLREKEVIVPEEKDKVEPPVETAVVHSPAQVAKKKRLPYVIQAGSFRRFGDADTVKARLAFQGIEANIQTVTLGSGEQWHRVRIGPFDSTANFKATKKVLKRGKVNFIILQTR